MPFLHHFVREKSWEAKTERIGLTTGPLEILPCWIRYKAFYDIARLFRDHRLVEYGEGHAVGEWPPQQSIILSGKNFYVY